MSARETASPPRAPGTRIDRKRALLLVVDVQERLAPHIAKSDALVARTKALIDAACIFGIPRLATEHCALQIGPLIPALRQRFEPAEIFAKTRFGAVDHPEFAALVKSAGRAQIVVAGMEAHVCAMQTILGLLALDYDVFAVEDALGSRRGRERDRELALMRVQAAGATLVGTETVLFEWTRDGEDPAFREVLAFVKALPR